MLKEEVVAERFMVEVAIASGGMGSVYRARDLETGRLVALKLLRGEIQPETVVRFEREATVLSRLSHPNIVEYVHRGVTKGGDPYIAMEWLEGEDLAETLRRGPLDVASTLAVGEGIARGLSYTHEHGVLHRDLKPANVFFVGSELSRVKVIDFGLARVLGEGSSTQTGALLGTPGYMAPEQVRDVPNLDARIDVFALGCVLYKCLTGRGPFAASDPTAALAKVLYDDAPRLSEQRPEIPASLDALVMRMLSKSRDERPRDGGEVMAALASIHASEAPAVATLTRAEKRVVCVVLAGHRAEDASADEATIRQTVERADAERLRAAVAPFGAELDVLPDGNVVATLLASRAATDQASRAARCAFAMREALPGVPIAIAMGRSEIDRRRVGEAIDRASALLAGGGASIHIDDSTAGLLDARFEVDKSESGFELRSVREVEATRTLLGRTTACVGRDRELETLLGVLDESMEAPGARAVVVTASAGMGKSRLRYELMMRIRERAASPDVWLARCDPLSAGSPFATIGDLVRRAAGIQDGEPLAERQRKLAARVARNVPEIDRDRVTEFLAELVGAPLDDADRPQLRSARLTPMLLGDQMKRAFGDFLAAECAARPLCLVFEDLHWGDLPSVTFVDAALRSLRDAPLFVLGLARPEVEQAFPQLWAERATVTMRLGPLSKRASEQMVKGVLGEKATSALTTQLVQLAAGNAFYLEELIRAVAEGKADLPETVIAMVEARLESLDEDERRLLRAASVFGQSFWTGALRALLGGLRPERVDALLATLTDKELVGRRPESRFPGSRELVFRHALVREAAYAMLTEADRALGHRLAGEWLENSGETDARILAEHLERGGEAARACAYYLRAAEDALAGNDFNGTLDATAAAERCGAEGEQLAQLRCLAAEATRWRGDASAALDLVSQAESVLPAGTPAWFRAAGEIAAATTPSGRVEVLERIYDRLLESLPKASPQGIVAGARSAVALLLAGKNERAATLVDRLEARAKQMWTDPTVRGAFFQVRSMQALVVGGDASEHIDLVVQAAEAFRQAGDMRLASLAQTNVGYGMLMLGDPESAEAKLREALVWSVPMGLTSVTAAARHNLGLALAYQGRLDEAITTERGAIDDGKQFNDRRLEGASRIYLSLMLAEAGDFGGAELEARRAIELVKLAAPVRMHALAALTHVLVLAGRNAEALGVALDGMATLESIGGVEEGEALMRFAYARALEVGGDLDGARREILLAKEKVEHAAGRIQDPQVRARFLARIPEHRQTLEMAARLGAR